MILYQNIMNHQAFVNVISFGLCQHIFVKSKLKGLSKIQFRHLITPQSPCFSLELANYHCIHSRMDYVVIRLVIIKDND